jgi:hypothetical protein
MRPVKLRWDRPEEALALLDFEETRELAFYLSAPREYVRENIPYIGGLAIYFNLLRDNDFEGMRVSELEQGVLQALRLHIQTTWPPSPPNSHLLTLGSETYSKQAVRDRMADLEPSLPDLPEPDTPNADAASREWLFESGREYMEQLEYYKREEA